MPRLRVVLALVLTIGAGAPAAQQPAQSDQVPTFRSSVEAVQISVVVTDANGTPVAGLTKDDFELFERRQQRPITTFSAVDIPLYAGTRPAADADVLSNDRPPGRVFLIAFDYMSEDLALRARHFLHDFIDRHFGPNDSAAVVLLTQGLRDAGQEFTSNPRLLLDAVDRFTGGFRQEGWAREKNFVGDFYALVKNLSTLPASRKALILLSGSVPGDADKLRQARTSRIGRMFSDVNPQFYDAVSLASRNNIAVYPVDPAGLTTELGNGIETFEARDSLKSLAEMTGGFAFSGSNNYTAAFERLVRENSTYYVLGFNVADEGTRGFNDLDVRVKRPGLQVRTLEGYLAPAEGKRDTVKRPTTVMAAAWDAVASPLTSGGITMRMFAAPYKSSGKMAMVEIAIEIATDRLQLVQQSGVYRGDLDILFAVSDAKKKRWPVQRHRAALALKADLLEGGQRRAIRVLSQLALPEGKYQVRASAGGEIVAGNVVYDVTIPNFHEEFSLSGVALTSVQARETLTVATTERLGVSFPGPPTTAREFAQSDKLTLFAEAYENRKKAHTVQFAIELRDESGKALDGFTSERKSAAQPNGASSYTFSPSLPLDDVAPGRYIVYVEAKSSLSKDPISRTIPIVVR